MKKIIYLLIIIYPPFFSYSQTKPNFHELDSLYREDQFYFSIAYNALDNKTQNISQKKFTPSFSLGFLRDMPINQKRTIAIATGLGYSINNYNENLLVTRDNVNLYYQTINSNIVYDRNKLVLHYIEIPLEIRWRTSTAESHKFYRIYGGIKASYLVYSRSKFVDDNQEILVTNIEDLNKFQYGAYVNFGYNMINFHVCYGMNPLFKSGNLNNQRIEMRNINFGLIFYIL